MEKIINNAWKNYKNHIVSFIGGYMLSFLIPLVIVGIVGVILFLPLITAIITKGFANSFEFLEFLASNFSYFSISLITILIVAIIVFPPFTFGFIYLVAQGSKGKKIKISMLLEGVKKFWKRAIAQQIIYLIIIALVSLPFVLGFLFSMKAAVNKPLINTPLENSTMNKPLPGFVFSSFILFIIWVIALLVVGFLLIFWTPTIVVYDKGVIEALKISLIKVRKNILETLVIFLIITFIGIVAAILGQVIPIIPTIVLSPLITAILVEACKSLK